MFHEITATGFFTGYLPLMPGTWSSWCAAICVYILGVLFPEHFRVILIASIVLLFILGVISSNEVARLSRRKDPGYIVIDEWAGQFLAFAAVTMDTTNFFLGFLLFRLFDIVKPYPIRKLEDFEGGMGIMLDDMMAGAYAAVSLYFVNLVFR